MEQILPFADLAITITAGSPGFLYILLSFEQIYCVRYSASCRAGSSRELGATMNGSSFFFEAIDAA